MEDRTVIEWDKDDLDALGIYKVDVLGARHADLPAQELRPDREALRREARPSACRPDDPAVYDMLCKADSVGVFQVESRAQMSMLPRLKPRTYYDLVVEVAIVRPGPIQGGMVHPYLKNRDDPEDQGSPIPARSSRSILERTLGVPLFQEQAMQIAIDCAGFAPGQGRQAAPRHGDVPAGRHDPQAQGRLHRRHGRQRLRARVRRALLQADRRLRRIRLPGEPCRELRHPGLRLLVGEVPLPRGLRRRPAQLPADGLLCAGPARARREGTWRRGAAARRECQRLGLHARTQPEQSLRAAPWPAPGHGPRGRRRQAHGRAAHRRPIAIRPTCGGAAGSPSARSWRWRAPTPSPRWACRAATCCGRCAASPKPSCRCSTARRKCATSSPRSPCPRSRWASRWSTTIGRSRCRCAPIRWRCCGRASPSAACRRPKC